jgi:hypothetical protein
MMKFISALIAAFFALVLVGTPAASAAPEAQINRGEVLKRAATWLTANNGKQVPYSMSEYWKDGYRTDCSGFVSMAANLGNANPKGGPNTVALATGKYTTPIKIADMKPGDLFIDPVDEPGDDFRHVVIFEKWTKADKSQYMAYEQRGGHGTDHRPLTYGLKNTTYKPYRLKNVTG